MKNCEDYKPLLMGLMDNELSPEELSELNEHMIRCSNCRQEYEELSRTCSKIDHVSFKEPTDEILGDIWKHPYSRFTRNSALLLILGGWLLLMGFAAYQFSTHGSLKTIPGVASAAMIIGFVILLFSVLRERLKTHKVDPYKEVER